MPCNMQVRLALGVALIGPGALAGVLHVPAGQPTIADAVSAAADGDIVLIAPGTWDEVVVVDGKAVSLVGDGPGVEVGHVTVRDLPAGAVVLLQNLVLGSPAVEDAALSLLDNAGTVLVRGCSGEGHWGWAPTYFGTQGTDGWPGCFIKDSGVVALSDCSFTGGEGGWLEDEDVQAWTTSGGPGLRVRGTQVALHEVTAEGGGGGNVTDTTIKPGGHGGAGLHNVSGTVHAAGSVLRGGHGGWGDCDHFLGACGSGGVGGDAVLQNDASASLTLRDNTHLPGAGGHSGDGIPAPSGADLQVLGGPATTFSAAHRSLAADSPVREGQLSSLIIQGLPGDQLVLLAGLQPAFVLKPALQGAFLQLPLLTIALGTPASGELTLSSTVPDLGPGIGHLVVHVQLVVGDGSGFLLGPAVHQVLLDAAE
jgi:hypothetical protein